MMGTIVIGVVVVIAYLALRPPRPKICGTLGGPPVSSPRVKLDDGRHLAFKECGLPKEEAKHKFIFVHGFDDSKDSNIPLSQERMEDLGIYVVQFDRAGYGESDPNPARTVKSEAFDIQELADKLHLGPKFYVIGVSLGGYPIYSCLYYIPHRLSGAALVVPFVNLWWKSFPANLSQQALELMPVPDRWTCRVAHYTPWLLYWWMTQKWFPNFTGVTSPADLDFIKHMSAPPNTCPEKVRQQGVHECLHRDMIAGFGKWEFEPANINNPFPNNEGSVHIWQGYEDKWIPYQLNRHLSQKLPWIHYHEIPGVGHLLMNHATLCEAIFKALL
ncbi:hypothetical protein ACS0TY_008133 [Phlomoides rotata]